MSAPLAHEIPGPARRGASAGSVTIMAPITCPAISRTRSMSGHRGFAVLRARTRGQWRRRALHPNLEGELALGADVQNHRGPAPSSSHSPGATLKLGSSRGMDTKRPRRSERSKPCHQLQLTRRSQPPYPWPPEQAQPGVSKPCRTTRLPQSTRIGTLIQPIRCSRYRVACSSVGFRFPCCRSDAANWVTV